MRKTIEHFDMLSHGDKVVVGVSGGADSVGLLQVLKELSEYDLELIVAHLNHGIRKEEGKRDAQFVKKIAGEMSLPFETKVVSAPEYKAQSNLSLEEAARVLRYEFYEETLRMYGATKIATAHTMDDQAETVLMRLLRGSGLLGLSGIPPVSQGNIIRPLIEVTKSEIKHYLRSKNVEWVEDSTNLNTVYLRNRIRYELVPQLQEYNPRIKETLARTSQIVRTEEEFITSRARNWLEYVVQSRKEDELVGLVSRYRQIPEALRGPFLRLSIEKIKGELRGIEFIHINSAEELLSSDKPSGEVSLPDELVIAKGYNLFSVAKKSELERKFSYTIYSQGKYSFPEAEFEIEFTGAEGLQGDESVGFFDPCSVEFPIEIRNFRPGDRFVPLGMKNSKKLKNYFIDEKVPGFLRTRVPLFTSKGVIMWIGGMRIDERFKVKGGKAIKISLIKPDFKRLWEKAD